MKPEALHSLSVVILVAGLFLSAMGMVGTFFFGKEADRIGGQQQLAVLQGLTDRVAAIQSDQAGIRDRIAGMDQRLATVSAPPPATPAPASSSEKTSIAAASPPAITPTPATPAPPSRIGLASKLPPIAEGPQKSSTKPDSTAAPKPAPPAKSTKPDSGAQQLAKLDMPPTKLPPNKPAAPKTKAPGEQPAGQDKPARSAMTEQQQARLVRKLRAYPQHAIVIRAEAGEAHSVELAMALRAAFRDAGWEVAAVQLDSKRAPFPGLSLSTGTFPPPPEFVAAFSALEGAGFRVASNLDPHQGNRRVILSVGAKR